MSMGHERQIIEQITTAFSSTSLPQAEALVNHHCCECYETSAAFGGKPWAEISLEEVLAGRETALLTAEAWRYYLPAVMIWCIRAPEAMDVMQDNLVYQLEPPGAEGGSVREWFEQRSAGFTLEQRQAIVAYLQWYREREEREWAAVGAEPPQHVYKALEFWDDTATNRH
jgi:hypothetical protein